MEQPLGWWDIVAMSIIAFDPDAGLIVTRQGDQLVLWSQGDGQFFYADQEPALTGPLEARQNTMRATRMILSKMGRAVA